MPIFPWAFTWETGEVKLQFVTSLNQDFKHFDIILTYVKPSLYYTVS